MRHTLLAGLVLLSFIGGGVWADTPMPEYRDGYLLVRFNETGLTSAANAVRESVISAAGGGTIQKMFPSVPGLGLVKLSAGQSVQTARINFASVSGIKYAEPDYLYRIQAIPNDTLFNEMWALRNVGQTGGTPGADISAPAAWDIHTGSDQVIVAVIDSGVDYTHPDLAANMWINTAEQNGTEGVDDDGNGYIDDIYGYDFWNSDADPMDDNSHGTHVAGTIGAVGNNSLGITGVNWKVKIMALKIGEGFVSSAAAIQALAYATAKGATISNNSWGGYGFSQALYDAINAARAQGMLFVAAAANDANDNDSFPAYPASYDLDNIISVMATDHSDVPAVFTNWGKTTVDLAAPGVSILSTIPNSEYDTKSGTSMASPHVAGAAALLKAIDSTLTYKQIKENLLSTADIKVSLKNRCVSEGRLNLAAAATLASEDTQAPTPNPMQWKVEPIAVGLKTIYMEAVTATDKSGPVEYFFGCINDDTFDSGWQTSSVYYRGDYDEGGSYQFKVRTRDALNNTGNFSAATYVTMPAEMPLPYPSPAQWKAAPRRTATNRISMEAAKGYTEADKISNKWTSRAIEYRFICTKSDDPNQASFSKEQLSSDWSTSPFHNVIVSPLSSPGVEYRFQVQIRPAAAPYAQSSLTGTERTIYMAPDPVVRTVGVAPYLTIQNAIDACNHGDTVIVPQGKIYYESNIDFKGKAITVRGQDPENPAVVAATIIDCQDLSDPNYNHQYHEPRRAFLFRNGEGRNSVLAGITIRNAMAVDDPQVRLTIGSSYGDPDQGDRYPNIPKWDEELYNIHFLDGQDAKGGAIYIGSEDGPASPTIRNCVFQDCSAAGRYGFHGANGANGGADTPGWHADRGGVGGNAYGGAIYATAGSAPLIRNTQFVNCGAVGGDGGNGGNGGNGGDHSQGVENADGYRGGDGGDGGWGGVAFGGAIYFESDCAPELYDVTVRNCIAQIGNPGRGGNGGNGSDATGKGAGGDGGNGGAGGDLRGPNAYAGAIYYGDNTEAIVSGCLFDNCRVIAQITGDVSGGNGGNGGNFAGDGGHLGGNGGHGGPAYFVPDKMFELGGITATGGTGGNGGGDGGRRGLGGNGGFRLGLPGEGRNIRGINWSLIPQQTGIFPSNMYYMSYYWEDNNRLHLDNPVQAEDNPEDLLKNPLRNDYIGYNFDWSIVVVRDPEKLEGLPENVRLLTAHTIFYSPYSPFFGFVEYEMQITPTVVPSDNEEEPPFLDYSQPTAIHIDKIRELPLTPVVGQAPDFGNSGACAGANYYGQDSLVTMTDTVISNCSSFANHGGAELYDLGCDVIFKNCSFENNKTLFSDPAESDFKFEGYGGAIFADQPVWMSFDNCTFSGNQGYAGGAVYCNFAPSQVEPDTGLEFKDSTFSYNRADYHFMNSYGGAVYAGNSLDAYEEFYFNNFEDLLQFARVQYRDHGYINFYYVTPTTLWDDKPEANFVLDGIFPPPYEITIDNSRFEGNIAPFGGGICLNASELSLFDTRFIANTGQTGAGGFVYASDINILDAVFDGNLGLNITSQGYLSEAANSTVQTLGYGAGLYLGNCDIQLSHSLFTANETEGYGAGLYIDGAPLSVYPQKVFNVLFANNKAVVAGGGLVAEGRSDVDVQNCTFADNSIYDAISGYGGGLSAHDTFVSVLNSLFWGNTAVFGSQIAVGDPLELLHPGEPGYIPFSTVFVEYSNVELGEEYVFVGDGEAPWLWYSQNNLSADPLFAAGSKGTYYLSQKNSGQDQDSPCYNAGSTSAASLGLDRYTTSTINRPDSGKVDLGYHYPVVDINAICRFADLAFGTSVQGGRVDVADLAVFAAWWLNSGCTAANNWCGGADITLTDNVDLFDFAFLSDCWSITDNQPPKPNPSRWVIEPRAVGATSIQMSLMPSTDDWSGNQVYYYFVNKTDHTKSSGPRQGFDPARPGYVAPPAEPWAWTSTGLVTNQPYAYVGYVEDLTGNRTDATPSRQSIPGQDFNPPTPNPAQWATPPYQSAAGTIRMIAVQATDPENNGVEYQFVCVNVPALSSGWRQGTGAHIYEVTGLTSGQTYTFYTQYRDRSVNQNTTGQSTSVSVTITGDGGADTTPPEPNPAAFTASSPFQVFQSATYWHVMAAEVAEDPSGVEYRFVCVDNGSLSSGWRNVDNVAGKFFPNGQPQTPQQYWVQVGIKNLMYRWTVQYRDRAPTPNVGTASPQKQITNTLP